MGFFPWSSFSEEKVRVVLGFPPSCWHGKIRTVAFVLLFVPPLCRLIYGCNTKFHMFDHPLGISINLLLGANEVVVFKLVRTLEYDI